MLGYITAGGQSMHGDWPGVAHIEVLQAYQANLLKDSDLNKCVSLDAVHRPFPRCHQADGSCHRPLSCCNVCHRVASVVKAFRTRGKGKYLLLDTLLSSSMLLVPSLRLCSKSTGKRRLTERRLSKKSPDVVRVL